MAYLNNQIVEIDAILTKKGREILSTGISNFDITQFALADDEIDYALWNPNHSLGATYYGEAIEALPILESNADETIAMKYFLVSLPTNTTSTPYITVAMRDAYLQYGESATITPTTHPTQVEQYRATLNDSTYFDLISIAGSTGTGSGTSRTPAGGSTTVTGTQFKLIGKNTTSSVKLCTVIITGLNTGATASVTGHAAIYSAPVPDPGTSFD